VKQNYQTIEAAATARGVPESVSVTLGEILADVRGGLLAMAVGTGLQVMAAMMDADVTAVCGRKDKHDPNRTAVRHGTEMGSVTLGGRRVSLERPRMRAVDRSRELPVPSYELFTSTEVLGRMAMQKMLAGIRVDLEQVTQCWPMTKTVVPQGIQRLLTLTNVGCRRPFSMSKRCIDLDIGTK
jgi:hypothetical protein